MNPSTSEPRSVIDLKILSPSSEVGTGGLQLRNVPVATTVGALKATITENVASHPGPERQRLIYLGRALARDDEELQNVFGRDVIQQDATHTLHLVLRDVHPLQNRPASVPPQPNSNPFRHAHHHHQHQPASTGPTPVQRNPFAAPQPPSPQDTQPQPPQQQPPQPGPQLPGTNIPIAHLLANANIRATSGGVPINLPPEVINQLLNQRLAQEGGFNFLANMQNRQQAPPPAQNQSQPNSAPSSNPTSEGPSPLQQHMAQHQQALAAMGMQQAVADANRGREQLAAEHEHLHSNPPGPPRRPSGEVQTEIGGQTDASPANPPASTPDTAASPAPSGPQQPQTHTVSRTGVNADGSRWRMNMTTTYGEGHHHHHHAHNHLPGQIPLLQPLPRMPPQFAPQAMHPAMRMGTPPAGGIGGPGLRPGGTPRSVSPSRSVSEGPRRVATPAAELQNRLEQTMREVGNVNRLLTVMATGLLANGGPAQPLSDQEREQLRLTAENMNQHIDGFGADLTALINAHPNMRVDPDFAALNSLYQSVQAQGRAIRNQAAAIAANGSIPATGTRGGDPVAQPAAPLLPHLPNPNSVESSLAQTGPTPSSAPSAQVTQQTDAHVPASRPEVHLLTDPSGTPQALLVGPTGPFVTPALSPEIMYALMAAQLPYEQLLQQFTQGVQQLTNTGSLNAGQTDNARLLQQLNNFTTARQGGHTHNDDNAVIRRITEILSQEHGRRQARRERRQQRDGTQPAPAQAAGAPAPAPGDPQNPAQAVLRAMPAPPGQNGAQQQQVARAGNNEVRDILAPIVRNLWLAVRIAGFAYFFLSSGRGYGRLMLLAGIAIIIYALNSGWLGRNVDGAWEGLRRHFEGLVNDARRGNAQAPAQELGHQNQNQNQNPNPEDTARRLLEQQRARNRFATRELMDRGVARARQIERGLALFVASLWPGVGEGVIRAQEQARREEEERREEEARKREEEEAEKKDAEGEVGADGDEGGAAERAGRGGEDDGEGGFGNTVKPAVTDDETFLADVRELKGKGTADMAVASGSGFQPSASSSGSSGENGELSQVNKGKAKAEESGETS